MRIFKITLPLAAFVLAVATSAFTVKNAPAADPSDPMWFAVESDGSLTFLRQASKTTELALTDCEVGTDAPCERAYDPSDVQNNEVIAGHEDEYIDFIDKEVN